MASYDEEFKKRLVRMHLEEGRTIKSLSEEYHVSENGIGYWLKKYREECSKNPAAQEEYDFMKENLRLRKEFEEAKKENEFLKKRQHSSHGKSVKEALIKSKSTRSNEHTHGSDFDTLRFNQRVLSSISVYKGKQGHDGFKMASEAIWSIF